MPAAPPNADHPTPGSRTPQAAFVVAVVVVAAVLGWWLRPQADPVGPSTDARPASVGGPLEPVRVAADRGAKALPAPAPEPIDTGTSALPPYEAERLDDERCAEQVERMQQGDQDRSTLPRLMAERDRDAYLSGRTTPDCMGRSPDQWADAPRKVRGAMWILERWGFTEDAREVREWADALDVVAASRAEAGEAAATEPTETTDP